MRSCLAFFLGCIFFLSSWVQAEPLRVGISPLIPLIFKKDTGFDGVNIDLWEEIARNQNIQYVYKEYEDSGEATLGLLRNEVDVVISPVEITAERSLKIAFTHPYYHSGLGMMTHVVPASGWDRIRGLVTSALAIILQLILMFLFLFAFLIWWVEKKKNAEQFPPSFQKGITSGLWFAFTTMTTVNYGDKMPTTWQAKAISVVWQVLGWMLLTSLASMLSASITVLGLPPSVQPVHPQMLYSKKIVVLTDTVAQWMNKTYETQSIVVDDPMVALKLLEDHQVEAFVANRTELQYLLRRRPLLSVEVADAVFKEQSYGFAFAKGRLKYFDGINFEILKARENHLFQDLLNKWTKTSRLR